MFKENRAVIFKSLVGSNNYNLNNEFSDKDYKAFVIPSFEDLYYGKYFQSNVEEKDSNLKIDCSYFDLRTLTILLEKSNPSYLEILFSKEIVVNDNFKKDISLLFEMKNEIARANLFRLYDCCMGGVCDKKTLNKGTAFTANLVEKFGYDTKEAMRHLRVLDLLERFLETDFTDFKKAIYYETNDPYRKFLLEVKKGSLKREEFDKLFKEKEKKLLNIKTFKEFEKNEETFNKMKEIFKDLVKKNI